MSWHASMAPTTNCVMLSTLASVLLNAKSDTTYAHGVVPHIQSNSFVLNASHLFSCSEFNMLIIEFLVMY